MPTSYPLSVGSCTAEIIHELGGPLGGPVEMREHVDRAGHHLVGMASWAWLEGRQARLRTRPPIDLTGATWTEATLRLTKVGAFAAYTWLEADTFELSDGTGATAGTYEAAAKVDDDSITLETSIGAAANGQTDIEGSLPNDQVALPLDFDIQRITAYAVVASLTNGLVLSSGQDILDLRTTGFGWTVSFWGLLNHVRATADGRTIPRLDLQPGQLSGEEQFVIFYRAGWATPEDDSAPLPLPKSGWLNSLFMEVLKAQVMGSEEPKNGSVAERLAAVKVGSFFADALARDQSMQPMMGTLDKGGWTSPYRDRVGSWFDRGDRLLPSV